MVHESQWKVKRFFWPKQALPEGWYGHEFSLHTGLGMTVPDEQTKHPEKPKKDAFPDLKPTPGVARSPALDAAKTTHRRHSGFFGRGW